VPKITFSCERETEMATVGRIVVQEAKSSAPSHVRHQKAVL